MTCEKVEDDDIEKETISADEYAYKLKKISLLIDQKADSDVDITSWSSISVTKRKLKLPLLELKKIGVDIKNWLHFWGQFWKIDKNLNIDEFDKFQYRLWFQIPEPENQRLSQRGGHGGHDLLQTVLLKW